MRELCEMLLKCLREITIVKHESVSAVRLSLMQAILQPRQKSSRSSKTYPANSLKRLRCVFHLNVHQRRRTLFTE